MGKDLRGKELGKGLTQRKDKRYSARFITCAGKRVEKYFEKLAEAKKWLAEARYNDSHGRLGASSMMTVQTWFDYWISELTEGLRDSTREHYRTLEGKWIKDMIGNMQISAVKPLHCTNVVNRATNEGLKAGTLWGIISLMRKFMSAAVENGIIETSPVTSSVRCKHEKKDEPRFLDSEEYDLFMETAKGRANFDNYAFVLQTGLRYGEITGLKWGDINWEKRSIRVNRQASFINDGGEFREGPPKSDAGYRMIPLTDEAYRILEKKKNERRGIVHMQYKDFVFVNESGVPIRCSCYNMQLRRIAAKAGMPKLSMHSLRHTFATRCIEAGMKPKTLQKILGHENIATTMNYYVHVTEEMAFAEMKKMENGVKMA